VSDSAPISGHPPKAADDDMVDLPKWIADSPLAEILTVCRDMLHADYRAANDLAIANQNAHFYGALSAAWLGLAAVALALLQLFLQAVLLVLTQFELGRVTPGLQLAGFKTVLEDSLGLPMFEGLAMLAALAAVLVGLWTARQRAWMLERHRAERVRLLKFRYLISPDLWSGVPERKQRLDAWLEDQLELIRALTPHSLSEWAEVEEPPRPPETIPGARYDDERLRALSRYYRETRLWAQMRYLSKKSSPWGVLYRLTYRLPQALFFITGIVVSAHFAAALFESLYHPQAHAVAPADLRTLMFAVVPLLLAVLLPACGATVRTVRLAYEFDRNALRSRAKKAALIDMERQMEREQSPPALLESLWSCEYVLESDHREWLRLMIEAEWFG